MKDHINTPMEHTIEERQQDQPAPHTESRLNERGSFVVMGHVKIFDPNTQETIVETRA